LRLVNPPGIFEKGGKLHCIFRDTSYPNIVQDETPEESVPENGSLKQRWGLAQGFFIVMGGLVLEAPGSFSGILPEARTALTHRSFPRFLQDIKLQLEYPRQNGNKISDKSTLANVARHNRDFESTEKVTAGREVPENETIKEPQQEEEHYDFYKSPISPKNNENLCRSPMEDGFESLALASDDISEKSKASPFTKILVHTGYLVLHKMSMAGAWGLTHHLT